MSAKTYIVGNVTPSNRSRVLQKPMAKRLFKTMLDRSGNNKWSPEPWNPFYSQFVKNRRDDFNRQLREIEKAERKAEAQAEYEALELAYLKTVMEREKTAQNLFTGLDSNGGNKYYSQTCVTFVPNISGVISGMVGDVQNPLEKLGIGKNTKLQGVPKISSVRSLRMPTRQFETSPIRIRDDKPSREILYQHFDKRRENVFTLTVGVLTPDAIHNGYCSGLQYSDLFSILASLGYDPLHPLADKAFRDKINRRLGDVILRSISSDRNDNIHYIKKRFAEIGKEVVDVVKSYLAGKDKPALAPNTIKTRQYRSRRGESLYPNGIETPLVETGALLQAISYKVITAREGKSDFLEGQFETGRYAYTSSHPAVHTPAKDVLKRSVDAGYKAHFREPILPVDLYDEYLADVARKEKPGYIKAARKDFYDELRKFIRSKGTLIR